MQKKITLLKSLFLYGFSLTLTILAERYLATLSSAPPLENDLAFYVLPYMQSMEYIADGAIVLVIILLFVYFFQFPNDIAFGLTCLGLFYVLRATSLILTPLPYPVAGVESYGFAYSISLRGMFPSGHTGFTFLIFFYFFKRFGWDVVTTFSFVSFVVVVLALLLSRGHYSIDIVGGVLSGYFAYNLARHPNVQKIMGYEIGW